MNQINEKYSILIRHNMWTFSRLVQVLSIRSAGVTRIFGNNGVCSEHNQLLVYIRIILQIIRIQVSWLFVCRACLLFYYMKLRTYIVSNEMCRKNGVCWLTKFLVFLSLALVLTRFLRAYAAISSKQVRYLKQTQFLV